MFKFYSFFVILCLIQLCLSAPTTESNPTPGSTTSATGKIELPLLNHLKNEGPTTIFLALESAVGILKELETDNLPREEKATAVHNALVAHAEATQAPVKAFLTKRNVKFTSYWINNSISIEDANLDLVESIAQLPQVERISGESSSAILS